MIEVKDTGIKSYHPDMDGDPLYVTKGYCHYSHEGTKDFLDYITAYQPEDGGVTFLVNTFRGSKAQVRIRFVSPTAFRFQMFPHLAQPKLNEVFGFAPVSGVQVTEEPLFIVVKTERVTLRLRKCPWEMTVELDGEPLTMEQIKDHNVDQKYKAVPVGFSVGDDGRILNAFETCTCTVTRLSTASVRNSPPLTSGVRKSPSGSRMPSPPIRMFPTRGCPTL